VTGASGFIGRHTLAPLAARGYEVHAVSSRHRDRALGNDTTWHLADLLDGEAVARLFGRVRPTHLLHCAWSLVPGQYAKSPANLAWVRASLDVINGLPNLAGSTPPSPEPASRRLVAGGAARRRRSPRLRCMALPGGAAHDGAGVCARSRPDARLCRIFFIRTARTSEPTCRVRHHLAAAGNEAPCSHGNQIRDFLHVEDVASALVAALDAGVHGPLNIASGEPVRLKEIIYRAADLIGRRDLVQLGAIPVPPDDPPLIVADTRRLARRPAGLRASRSTRGCNTRSTGGGPCSRTCSNLSNDVSRVVTGGSGRGRP
jgi:uncharacterized protein YbjT (DUF2867 family)